MKNGAVGGDRGCVAALVSFRLAVETAAEFEAGENIKMRKPIESTAAKTRVIGLVLRSDRARAILRGYGQRQATRGVESPDAQIFPGAPRAFALGG